MVSHRPTIPVPMSRCGGRQGVALAFAVFGLFVVECVVGTAVLLALAERKSGRGYVQLHRAAAVAEAAAYEQLTAWGSSTYAALRQSDRLAFSGPGRMAGTSYTGAVSRVGKGLFVVTAVGQADRARQRVGLVVRISPVTDPPRAALTAAGPLRIGDGAELSGEDAVPANWSCDPPEYSAPAILISAADSATQLTIDCATGSCLEGDPTILTDSVQVAEVLSLLEESRLAEARHRAIVIDSGSVVWPQPVAANATCVTARSDNWGDPYASGAPCGLYFPLVFASGDLEIRGGRGQGVLVVAGDLLVSGGFYYAGLVAVKGRLRIEGIGNRIVGGVAVAGAGGDWSWVAGRTIIKYSSCALERGLRGSGHAERLRERSWFHAY